MTEPRDPFEVLADLDPIDPARVREEASSPRAQATLETILAEPKPSKARARIRPRAQRLARRQIYAFAAIALLLAAAGTAWALTRASEHEVTIGCYAAENLSADTVVVPAGATAPTTTCRAIWERGDLGPRLPAQLESCVLPSGAIGVFPSEDGRSCERLELSPAVPKPSAAGSVKDLKDALAGEFLAHRCLSRTVGVETAKAELRALDLSGWDVRITTPFTQLRSCTSFAFDEDRRLVLIVPIPPQP